MKTLAEIYDQHKGEDCHSGTDKGTVHSFIEVYEEILAPYRLSAKRVLEIGILTGASLRLWEEYFALAEVHGTDICDRPLEGLADLRPMIKEGSHHISLFDATDPVQVEQHFGIGTGNGTPGSNLFDVIIEDASHSFWQQTTIYANFRTKLAPGGIYIIEDVDCLDEHRIDFENIDPTRSVKILDRRAVKSRYDDVLIVITDKPSQ